MTPYISQTTYEIQVNLGITCNDHERQLLSLPVKMSDLGIINVMEMCDLEFQQSVKATRNLVRKIVNQNEVVPIESNVQQTN
jgi:hypothetical protein